MNSKEFYRTYIADDNWSPLSRKLMLTISDYSPVHVLEFGSGSGKHIRSQEDCGVVACGLDISVGNLAVAHYRNQCKFLVLGDESHLRHLCNFDVVFTCSVLDHIEDVCGIVDEFKRIANKAVILAETNDHWAGNHYFAHDYEAAGFKKLDFHWRSDHGDGATYYIWVWEKNENSEL